MKHVEIEKPKLLSPLVPLGMFALGIVVVMIPSPVAFLFFLGGVLTAIVRVMQAVSHFNNHKEKYIAQAPLWNPSREHSSRDGRE